MNWNRWPESSFLPVRQSWLQSKKPYHSILPLASGYFKRFFFFSPTHKRQVLHDGRRCAFIGEFRGCLLATSTPAPLLTLDLWPFEKKDEKEKKKRKLPIRKMVAKGLALLGHFALMRSHKGKSKGDSHHTLHSHWTKLILIRNHFLFLSITFFSSSTTTITTIIVTMFFNPRLKKQLITGRRLSLFLNF